MPDYGGLLSHKLESKVHARMDELFEVFKKKADPKEALDTLNEWCNLLQEHAYGLYTQARKDLELS